MNNLERLRPSQRLPHPRNVTIEFARFMQANGEIPDNMSMEDRMLIGELLDADRMDEDRVQVVTIPTPARPTAEDLFPGYLRPNKRLHWGLGGNNPESLGSHYNKVDFQRALYSDGVDPRAIHACQSNAQLASLWLRRRDDLHSNEPRSQVVERETAGATAVGDAGDAQDATVHPNASAVTNGAMEAVTKDNEFINMATGYAEQYNVSGSKIQSPTMSPQSFFISLDSETQTSKAPENRRSSAKEKTVRGNGKKKPEQNYPERNLRIALAARVERFPLSLPGNNKGRPLTMQRKIEYTKNGQKAVPSWSTYKAKYNRHMAAQLLKDYNVLPLDIDLMTNAEVFQRLVVERDLIHAQNIPLQVIWTNEYLQAYVADLEAKGLIPPLAPTPTFAPTPTIQLRPPISDPQSADSVLEDLSRKELRKNHSRDQTLPYLQPPCLPGASSWAVQSGRTLVKAGTTLNDDETQMFGHVEHQQDDTQQPVLLRTEDIFDFETLKQQQWWQTPFQEQNVPQDLSTCTFNPHDSLNDFHAVAHPEISLKDSVERATSSAHGENVEPFYEQPPLPLVDTNVEDHITIDPRLLGPM